MNTAERTLTPAQLNRQVRSLLESHFDFVWVEGEISNMARPSSGHWYFTLKDDAAQVRCAMFKNRNQRLRFSPENGEQVRLRARVSLYEGRGEFQLIGEFMEPAGAGALQAQFDALRDRLKAEGLFDLARKLPLPKFVSHLAIITSPTGAALQDILQVLARRNPAIRISILPASVQGAQAPRELRDAVLTANRLATSRYDCRFDAIILARGGGSLEDLWAFNDEALARTIAASDLPIVCGVGHETDISIADFAASVRAPTPSAAAELLSEDRAELLIHLQAAQRRLTIAMAHRLDRGASRLTELRARLRHPGDRLREQAQRVDELEARLRRAMYLRLENLRRDQTARAERLRSHTPMRRLMQHKEQLSRQKLALGAAVAQKLRWQQQALERRQQLLASLSPLAILDRGYAILSTEAGTALRSTDNVAQDDRVTARLARGRLRLRVEEVSTEADGAGGTATD